MSIKLMSQILETPCDTPAEKLLLLAIANYADDDGNNIWPSKKTLANKTDLDERTVQRLVAKLVAAKVLIVVREALRQPTIYRLELVNLTRTKPSKAYRQNAGTDDKPEPANPQAPTGPHAEATGHTPPYPSDNHQNKPPVEIEHPHDPETLGAPPLPFAPEWAADWPVLHVEGGDYVVPLPYAECDVLREGVIEWISQRIKNKKAGMPTVYGLRVTNCGWWDKYPLEAVVHAVQRAAGSKWRGIIEDIAKEWKPNSSSASSLSGSVQHSVQRMASTMEQRQAMIREAAASHGQGPRFVQDEVQHGQRQEAVS